MFSSFFTLLALGIPLAWTTGSLGLIFAFFMWGPDAMSIVVLRVWDVMGSFSMIAIPLFVFMGNMLQKSGIATPGEAAGVGSLGAILCAGVRKRLNWENLSDSLYETMKTVGLILWIVFGAMVFIATYTLGGGADFVKDALVALPLNPWLILIIIQIILLVLGMVLDIIGITVLLAPIFVPVITQLGFDPLWFGVIFNLNLQIAYLSPPFGYSIFYLKAVAPPDVTMMDFYKSVLPYMGLQIIGMILCMIFPQIILWLPNLMMQ